MKKANLTVLFFSPSRFDTGGPGSCLKRYSDPTFFKRTSTSGKVSLEKVRSDKKAHKVKVCSENLGVICVTCTSFQMSGYLVSFQILTVWFNERI